VGTLPIATDVAHVTHWSVCLSACVLGTLVCCEKSAQPIDMPFRGLTPVGLRSHALNGGPDANGQFLRGDKTVMRPFAKLL